MPCLEHNPGRAVRANASVETFHPGFVNHRRPGWDEAKEEE
jgi:hypothetical protein